MPSHLVFDLAVAWGAAFIGGSVAQRLRQPPIVGYLVAGIAIGPFTPGPVIHGNSIEVLAEIGVAFLMFALGVEFSFGELRELGRIVTLGGPLQVVVTMFLGPLVAGPLGLTFRQGLFLGALLALSSTVVALKVLMSQGETQSLHGRVTIGLLIAQDLAVVPLVVLLPTLTGSGAIHVGVFLLIVVKAAGVVAGVYLIGARAAPWLLEHAALGRSRELFLLGTVGLALGTALLTQAIGLSLAFGAFLAGLVVAESEYRTQALAEVLPLRDLFTSLFFVSIGLLVDPLTLAPRAGLIALLSAVTVVGKTAVVTPLLASLGVPVRAALLAAVSLAQIGEFSFVLARLGVGSGALPQSTFNLILATSLVTLLLSSPMSQVTPALLGRLERLPGLPLRTALPIEGSLGSDDLHGHTVICGYGRVGREVAYVLEQHGRPYVVVEYNPAIAQRLRSRGVPVIYGDAGNPVVLTHAGIGSALLLAVLIPDPGTSELTTRTARRMNQHLDILARATDEREAERLREAGATNVVQPEFEAGVAVVGHALRRYGLSGPELARASLARRAAFYRIRRRGS